jgi:uncharacterized protein YfaS (alpha-2-macroglobulin family)
LKLSLADSITTWRLTVLGNSSDGALGSTTLPIRVFQDFFVDIDLPVAFTQGDEVSVPRCPFTTTLPNRKRFGCDWKSATGFEVLGNRESRITLQPQRSHFSSLPLEGSKVRHTRHHRFTAYGEGK